MHFEAVVINGLVFLLRGNQPLWFSKTKYLEVMPCVTPRSTTALQQTFHRQTNLEYVLTGK